MFSVNGEEWHIDKDTELLEAYRLHPELPDGSTIIMVFIDQDLSVCTLEPGDVIPKRISSNTHQLSV